MQKFIFHGRHYFKLGVSISPLYFVLLYFAVTLISTPLLMGLVDSEQMIALLHGEIYRLDFFPRLCFALYELLLVPLYIKRMADMGWQGKQRDVVLISILLPVVLTTVFSDGAYMTSLSVIAFFRLLALILTFMLFVFPTKAADEA